MKMCCESENLHFSHIFFNMDISIIKPLEKLDILLRSVRRGACLETLI